MHADGLDKTFIHRGSARLAAGPRADTYSENALRLREHVSKRGTLLLTLKERARGAARQIPQMRLSACVYMDRCGISNAKTAFISQEKQTVTHPWMPHTFTYNILELLTPLKSTQLQTIIYFLLYLLDYSICLLNGFI